MNEKEKGGNGNRENQEKIVNKEGKRRMDREKGEGEGEGEGKG